MSRIEMNPNTGWQQVVVFEVDGAARAAVDAFARPIAADIRILPAEKSPSGYAWYEAQIDFSHGERRAIHIAGELVDALERADLQGYRLIAGREWLELATTQASSQASAA
jgi:hypothetical protein